MHRRELVVRVVSAYLCCLIVAIGCAVSAEPKGSDAPEAPSGGFRPHRLEFGTSVSVCVWGPEFVSTCHFGGVDFHGVYLYRFHERFGAGVFGNAGWVIAVDMGLKLRVWLLRELLYADIDATVMAPRYVIDHYTWFYGFETVLGASLPEQGRARFIAELQVLFLFNEYGYLGFLRPFVGMAVTLGKPK
jgi:hypothetical protein